MIRAILGADISELRAFSPSRQQQLFRHAFNLNTTQPMPQSYL
ncbi:TilS substrate-binding domain-containing protein [Idiomarina sp. A28L]